MSDNTKIKTYNSTTGKWENTQNLISKLWQDTTSKIINAVDSTKALIFDNSRLTTATTTTMDMKGTDYGDNLVYVETSKTWKSSKDAPVYKDLIGIFFSRGNTAFNTVEFKNGIYGFATDVGVTEGHFTFHTNHDLLVGSDIYIHLHIATNIANETGTCKFLINSTVAKIDSAFSASITHDPILHTFNGTQYKHIVIEVPFATANGSSTTFQSSTIDIDSIVLVRVLRDTADSQDTANSRVFLLQCDLHYLACKEGTRLKSPPFI